MKNNLNPNKINTKHQIEHYNHLFKFWVSVKHGSQHNHTTPLPEFCKRKKDTDWALGFNLVWNDLELRTGGRQEKRRDGDDRE